MTALSVRLFGSFSIHDREHVLEIITARKVQELFCYLLLFRERRHMREVLANALWGELSTIQSKAYLRKALWQLQCELGSQNGASDNPALLVDSEWIQLNEKANLWLDVAEFEQSFAPAQGIPGEKIDNECARALQQAVALYRGDLLADCYQDWCVYERQRLQHMYLTMLDKLVAYCEVHREYETGLDYGSKILLYDRAHEATHRRLMRLHYLSGDRTRALRQYENCVGALKEDLNVRPTDRTIALYEQIKTNQLTELDFPSALLNTSTSLPELLGRLRQLQVFLEDIQDQLQRHIQVIERTLDGPSS